MLGPNGAYLLLAGEFASRSRGLGAGDGSALIGREWHRLAIDAPAGQRQHGARNLILLVSRQLSNGFHGVFKQFGHDSEMIGCLEDQVEAVAEGIGLPARAREDPWRRP